MLGEACKKWWLKRFAISDGFEIIKILTSNESIVGLRQVDLPEITLQVASAILELFLICTHKHAHELNTALVSSNIDSQWPLNFLYDTWTFFGHFKMLKKLEQNALLYKCLSLE